MPSLIHVRLRQEARFCAKMTRLELDSLTVVKSGTGCELRNSSGFVQWFKNRDAAYAAVREFRARGARV